jgi:hypothetical protein
VTAYAQERALHRIADLSAHALDLVSFWREASDQLTPHVPHYIGPCWYTLDPASLLITSHLNPGQFYELPREWLELEHDADEPHCLAGVGRSTSGASTLHEATRGDLRTSRRWQAWRTIGGDQEPLISLRTRAGHPWGALALYREAQRPLFSSDEIAFVSAAAPHLAEGARRALLLGEASDPEGPEAPALVVVSSAGEVESTTPGAER